MGDTTTNRHYPKPLSTDPASGLTQIWRDLADAIDTDVANLILSVPIKTIRAFELVSSDSGTTSGTTELKDSAVADLTFTAISGHRYEVVLAGRGLKAGTAGDRFSIHFRDGGGSSPGTGSTLWGHDITKVVPAATVVDSFHLSATDTPTAGTHTLGVFIQRVSGTGTISMSGSGEFYVRDCGPTS